MLQRLFLLALLTFSLAASASGGSSHACERAMQSVLTITKSAIANQVLKAEDIEYMLGDPTMIRNPFERATKHIKNYQFRQVFERNFAQLAPETLPALRLSLRKLFEGGAHDRTRIAKAQEDTEFVFAPKEIPLPNVNPFRKGPHTFWHKDKSGNPHLVIFHPATLILDIFPLSDVRSGTRRNLDGPKATWNSGDTISISESDGNLLIGYLPPWQKQALVYDFDRDETTIVEIPHETKRIYFTRGANHKIYLVAQTPKSFTTYAIENKIVSQIHVVTSQDTFQAEHVMTSADGRILLMYRTYDRTVHVVDPLLKTKREFQLNDETASFDGAFLPDGKYVLVLITKNPRSPKYRLTFLDSHSDSPRLTPFYENGAAFGALVQTSHGKLYVPVGVNELKAEEKAIKTHYDYEVQIYDALRPTEQTLWNRITGTSQNLKPILHLPGAAGLTHGPPVIREPHPRQLIVWQRISHPNNIYIYEPQKKRDPITDFEANVSLSSPTSADNAHFEIAPVSMPMRYLLQLHTHENHKTEFFEPQHPVTKIGEVPHRAILPPITDAQGATYLLTDDSRPGRPWSLDEEIHLYQLTTRGPR